MNTTTWKTIKINTMTKAKILKALKDKKVNISSYAQSMIDKIDFGKEEKLNLIKITPKEMGLTGYPTTTQIYEKAKELGYELCPPETALFLRLHYLDQPLYNWIKVGMEPIAGSDGHPGIFRVARGVGGLWLGSYWTRPLREWNPDSEFVFRFRTDSQTPMPTSESLVSSDTLTLSRAIKICKENGLVVTKVY